ncbi:MAG: dihydrodipicolinate synthase family protein [Chloroflexota bacterium]|nr:MAG: dihydrodipicolinate synthase family protein [Chloroflexota bacterium]
MPKTSAFVMSITPFDSHDRLDEAALRRHLRRMAAAGLAIYLGSPGSGEGHALTPPELRRVFEIGVEECKGKVPVYATGFEPHSAEQLVAIGREAEAAGLDALLIHPLDGGHGFRPTPAELEQYYRDVLTAIKLPAQLVSHGFVGYVMPIDILQRLVEDYPITGINVGTTDLNYLVGVHRAVGSKVSIYSGGFANTITNLSLGGEGFVDGIPNIAPKLCMSVVNHFRAGRIDQAGKAYSNVMAINSILYDAFPPPMARVLKVAMNILGLPAGYLRKPFLLPDEAAQEKLEKALKELDVISLEENA